MKPLMNQFKTYCEECDVPFLVNENEQVYAICSLDDDKEYFCCNDCLTEFLEKTKR